MRRPKPHTIRNKLDLTDRTQVRLVRKRLGLSDVELTHIVDRIGNSLAEIGKEAALLRARTGASRPDLQAGIIVSKDVTEQTTNDATAPVS
jgi:hypothetical protein